MPRKDAQGDVLHCSFCGKAPEEVQRLIAGPTAYICDECIDLCNDILREEGIAEPRKVRTRLLTPKELHTKLDDYIIGQTKPKKILSVAVYNPPASFNPLSCHSCVRGCCHLSVLAHL